MCSLLSPFFHSWKRSGRRKQSAKLDFWLDFMCIERGGKEDLIMNARCSRDEKDFLVLLGDENLDFHPCTNISINIDSRSPSRLKMWQLGLVDVFDFSLVAALSCRFWRSISPHNAALCTHCKSAKTSRPVLTQSSPYHWPKRRSSGLERFCPLRELLIKTDALSYFQPRFKPSSRHSRNVIKSGIMMSQATEFQVLFLCWSDRVALHNSPSQSRECSKAQRISLQLSERMVLDNSLLRRNVFRSGGKIELSIVPEATTETHSASLSHFPRLLCPQCLPMCCNRFPHFPAAPNARCTKRRSSNNAFLL